MRLGEASQPYAAGELGRPVQQVERRKIIDAAAIVAPARAAAEQNPGIGTRGRLAHLHIKTVGMQRDLARDGDAARVGAQIEGASSSAAARARSWRRACVWNRRLASGS